MMGSFALWASSTTFVEKITSTATPTTRRAPENLLDFSRISVRRPGHTIATRASQSGDKLFTGLPKSIAHQVERAQELLYVITRSTAGLTTFTNLWLAFNTTVEAHSNFLGITITEPSRRPLLRAHTMVRTICLKTQTRFMKILSLSSLRLFGSICNHKAQSQACTT